ncbi:MAG: phasin family protein [Candidatus Aminicenantes bacterium]|nr:phasin family protein [Candidatus Aminicenantes bacterium]
MLDIIKKTILAGLGLISLTREKAEEIAKDLIKRGELAETEEAKFVKDLLEQAEKSKAELEKKLEKTVEAVLTKLNIPTRKEFEELKARVEEMAGQKK